MIFRLRHPKDHQGPRSPVTTTRRAPASRRTPHANHPKPGISHQNGTTPGPCPAGHRDGSAEGTRPRGVRVSARRAGLAEARGSSADGSQVKHRRTMRADHHGRHHTSGRGGQGKAPKNTVALTVDDATTGHTPRGHRRCSILLAANGVPATFSLIGRQARAYPGLVRRIVAAGHGLCNHSMTHPRPFAARSTAAIRQQHNR